MSVGRICTREVDLAAPDEAIRTAAQRMADRRVGALVVLDEARHPIGVLSDRDLVLRVIAPGKDPQATTVSEVMTRDPKTFPEAGPIEGALGLMRASGCRRLPIVDEAGRLVGILTVDDVLALLAEEFAQLGGIVGRQSR